MNKPLIILLSVISTSLSAMAQDSNILSSFSPKLRNFCIHNPAACSAFTNAFAAVFSNRTVSLCYFYSDDESKPRAFHYYPQIVGVSEVVICVRENQEPLDEFITILFEMLNSKNESRFGELFDRAKAGSILKADFANDMMRVEFEAVRATQDILNHLKLSRRWAAKTWYYRHFISCPREFEEFVSYTKKVSSNRDPIKEYEAQYDAARKLTDGK
jgi:hypothetical protein